MVTILEDAGVSAKSMKGRDSLAAAIALIEAGGAGALVVAKLDRLSARSSTFMAIVHPAGYEPMVATASKRLEGNGWAFKPKLDGWRALVHVGGAGIIVYTRPAGTSPSRSPSLLRWPMSYRLGPCWTESSSPAAGRRRASTACHRSFEAVEPR